MKDKSNIYPVIGMSPGNSYFKEDEITYLLKTTIDRFGKTAILIADIPAISTYIALDYPENRARTNKAIAKGNNLKNKVKKIMEVLELDSNQVRIIDWGKEVENNEIYQEIYNQVEELYKSNDKFKQSVRNTTKEVLKHSQKKIEDIEKAIDIAKHYLLSEIAFLEFASKLLSTEKVSYLYHKNWPIYEDYISGIFDGVPKPHLDFLLIENPYETYNPIWGLEEDESEINKNESTLDRIKRTKILRAGFTHNEPSFMYNRKTGKFSGIFYEIISLIAKKYDWKIQWTEEIGYGVVEDGLEDYRFDIFATTVWPTEKRKLKADFSIPIYHSNVYVYGRENNDNLKTVEDLKNNPHSRIAITEGDIQDDIARSDFPNTRRIRIPQLADTKELLRFVVENKADATFVEPYLAEFFNSQSDLKVISLSKNPIRYYEDTLMMRKGEDEFKDLINKEISIIKENGKIQELIEKYTGDKNTYLFK